MKRIFLSAAVALASMAGAAMAATITVSGISGVWSDAQPGTANSLNGVGTSQLRWGASTGSGQSGYNFISAGVPIVDPASPFQVGTFQHLNNPVIGPSITSADLSVTVTGDVDGVAFSIGWVGNFAHVETPNNATPCAEGGGTPCRDRVTLVGNSSASDTINVDGDEYFFDIVGFVGGIDFFSPENGTNSSPLMAVFSLDPGVTQVDPIPLPAGLPLLLTGAGLLAWLRRRKLAA